MTCPRSHWPGNHPGQSHTRGRDSGTGFLHHSSLVAAGQEAAARCGDSERQTKTAWRTSPRGAVGPEADLGVTHPVLPRGAAGPEADLGITRWVNCDPVSATSSDPGW